MLSYKSHLVSLPEMTNDETLPPISHWTLICGFSLGGIVGIALGLAAIIQYPVKITANGMIRPDGDIRLVQAPAEAIVKTILVKENQHLQQGQVVATLDDSQLQIKKRQIIATIQNDQAQLERFEAQLGALSAQRIAESNLMNRAIAAAQADLKRAEREHEDRRITIQADVDEAQADLTLAQKNFDRYQQLATQGIVSRQQKDEKEQAYQVARAKLERAKTGLNPNLSLVAIAAERIDQERAKGESMLASLEKERETLRQRREELQNQLNRDQSELKQVESDIDKYVIRATESGTLFKLNLRNSGQVVRATDSLAHIASKNSTLIVKAQVATQDIGRTALNQRVQLRINAYPYPDYGILTGKVVAIAPDATPSSADEPTGQKSASSKSAAYYEVAIQPEMQYLKNDSKNRIQAGMEVTAEIIVREETVLTFLLRKARLLTDL